MQIDSSLSFSGVEVSGNEIRELDNGKAVAFIPKKAIRSITLNYGTSANRPIAQLIIGIILIGGGMIFFFPIIGFLIDAMQGNTSLNQHNGYKFFAFGAPLVFIGAVLIKEVFKKIYYLLIVTDDGSQKISFKEETELLQIRKFIREAEQKFNYHIDSNLEE